MTARMDAPDGPVCGCGRPSARESGRCETCASPSDLAGLAERETQPSTCPECGAPERHRAWGAGHISVQVATCGAHSWHPTESALQAEALTAPDEQWACGWARRDGQRLTLVVEGRALVGEDLGEPSERWRGEVGGRLVGQWMGTGCASLALRWLATGEGAS